MKHRHSKKSLFRNGAVIALGLFLVSLVVPEEAEAQYMGKGAGVGALLGLALGDGYILEDVAAGAALGAAGGGIANMATGGKKKRRQREMERRAYEEQRRRAEYDAHMAERERRLREEERRWQEQKVSEREQELLRREARIREQERLKTEARDRIAEVSSERDDAVQSIINAIGPDAWEGYKALRGCNPDRAYALAKVAATSQDEWHQLAGLWLEAMVAVDERDTATADAMYQRIVAEDPEIDTVQQASMATDQAVLDMRDERWEIGITCR